MLVSRESNLEKIPLPKSVVHLSHYVEEKLQPSFFNLNQFVFENNDI